MMRATSDEQRTTRSGLRAAGVVGCVGRRAAASGDRAPDDKQRAASNAPRAKGCVPRRAAFYGQRATQVVIEELRATRRANPIDLLGSNKPMVLTATGVRWIARPAVAAAHRRAVRPQSDEATGDNGVHSGARLGPADNEQRAADNERRVTGSVMRATSDEPRTTSGDLRAVSVGLRFGRRATASGDKAPDDRRRAAGHAPRATACVRPRAAVYGQRATQAASDEPWATRLANPGDLLGSNKPMMLVATNRAEDRRAGRRPPAPPRRR